MASGSRCCGLFPVFILFFVTAALGQDTSTGAIRGTVSDSAEARIGGARVVLVNTATNFRNSTTTDVSGRFVFELLPPGDYSARAESPGMSPQTTPRLQVDVGGTIEVVFKLAVAGAGKQLRFPGSLHWSKASPAGSRR
jgi:hypothetical protein